MRTTMTWAAAAAAAVAALAAGCTQPAARAVAAPAAPAAAASTPAPAPTAAGPALPLTTCAGWAGDVDKAAAVRSLAPAAYGAALLAGLDFYCPTHPAAGMPDAAQTVWACLAGEAPCAAAEAPLGAAETCYDWRTRQYKGRDVPGLVAARHVEWARDLLGPPDAGVPDARLPAVAAGLNAYCAPPGRADADLVLAAWSVEVGSGR